MAHADDPQATRIAGRLRPDVGRLWARFYPAYSDHAFLDEVAASAGPDDVVLDIGAGSGVGLQAHTPLKGVCRRLVGVDLDPRVLDNPQLDEAHVADAAVLPFPDETFDLVYHTMVAEHLEDPRAAFAEMARVLKPGGRICFQTPNRLYYPMLVAQATPTRLHQSLVRRFGSGRNEAEVFPTFYRANTAGAVRRLASEVGLRADVRLVAVPPGYLRFHPAAFLSGVLYERIVEGLIPPLRGQIWATLTKPGRA